MEVALKIDVDAFSKKFENHCNALALYFFFYNFCRIHKSLRTSPAQAAGVTDELLDMSPSVQTDGRCEPGQAARAVQEAGSRVVMHPYWITPEYVVEDIGWASETI